MFKYELLTSIMVSSTVSFYSHTLYLLCVSFVISVVVINISRNRKNTHMPASIRAVFIDGFIGQLFCSGFQSSADSIENHSEELKETPLEEQEQSDNHHIIQMNNSSSKAQLIQNEWIRLAKVIDRIAFVTYIIIFILMGFIHFI